MCIKIPDNYEFNITKIHYSWLKLFSSTSLEQQAIVINLYNLFLPAISPHGKSSIWDYLGITYVHQMRICQLSSTFDLKSALLQWS